MPPNPSPHDLQSRLAILETRIERMDIDAKEGRIDRDQRFDQIEVRVSKLEMTIWKAAGALGAVVFVIELALRFVPK